MVRVVFNLEKMQSKMMLAIIIMTTFTIVNMMLPRDEYGITEGYGTTVISNMDMLEYSILSQVCASNPKIYAKTLRAKLVGMCQLMLGYGVLLIA